MTSWNNNQKILGNYWIKHFPRYVMAIFPIHYRSYYPGYILLIFADIRKVRVVFFPKIIFLWMFYTAQIWQQSSQWETTLDLKTVTACWLTQGLRVPLLNFTFYCPEDNVEPKKQSPLSEYLNSRRHKYQPTT